MIDFIFAVFGKKHCSWCIDKNASWFQRLIRADIISKNPKLYKFIWFIYDDISYKLGIWRLGQNWHWRFHQ